MKQIAIQTTQGVIRLNDRNYLAAGGQAAVYRVGKVAYKVYHDHDKMIPVGKIQELSKLSGSNIIKPLEIVTNAHTGEPVGYAMRFFDGCAALCKLFTRTFKDTNHLGIPEVAALMTCLQNTVQSIHGDRCLVVDLNELNVLLPGAFDDVVMIDTDSYQTPGFAATAIMDSIRDRSGPPGKFNEGTDWFSFAVLAVQSYLGIHPYKGRHPDYKLTEWQKRMDDGISIFDPQVRLPATAAPVSVIPAAHRKWFEGVFTRNERSRPPLPDASEPLPLPTGIQIVQGTANFDVTEIESYDAPITWAAVGRLGIRYVATTKSIFYGSKALAKIHEPGITARLAASASNELGIALHRGPRVAFFDIGGREVGSMKGHGLFTANELVYTVHSGALHQIKFQVIQGTLLADSTVVDNITELAYQLFDGCVIQDLLGRLHVSIPVKDRVCLTRKIPEVDGCRVIEAKARKGFLVVLAESGGRYDRFYYSYALNTDLKAIRQERDVALEPLNLAVKDNGMALLATDSSLKLFTADKAHEITGAPVDSGTALFAYGNDVFFTHDNTVFQFKSKQP